MGTAKITTLMQGGTPTLIGLWTDDKPGGSEGAVCRVINSAFYPVLTEEAWVYHSGMWSFIPPPGVMF